MGHEPWTHRQQETVWWQMDHRNSQCHPAPRASMGPDPPPTPSSPGSTAARLAPRPPPRLSGRLEPLSTGARGGLLRSQPSQPPWRRVWAPLRPPLRAINTQDANINAGDIYHKLQVGDCAPLGRGASGGSSVLEKQPTEPTGWQSPVWLVRAVAWLSESVTDGRGHRILLLGGNVGPRALVL